jgi:hypothetical protein
MSSGVQTAHQPLVWTRNEELCLYAVNNSFAYRSLLAIALFTPALYFAQKLQINLTTLSLEKKLFTAGTLTLLNGSLAYAPLRYLQKNISPKLATQQQELVKGIKTAHETFEKNLLFTDDQATTINKERRNPGITWESLQAEFATMANKDKTLQQSPLKERAAWAAQWKNIQALYQFELHASLPDIFKFNSFITNDSVGSFNACVERGQLSISLAQEIQSEFENVRSLIPDNSVQLNDVIQAFEDDAPENMEALNPALRKLAQKTRDYLAARYDYCDFYDRTCLRENDTLRAIMKDPCFMALSQPPEEKLSEEWRKIFQIYAICIATIAGLSVGGL